MSRKFGKCKLEEYLTGWMQILHLPLINILTPGNDFFKDPMPNVVTSNEQDSNGRKQLSLQIQEPCKFQRKEVIPQPNKDAIQVGCARREIA